MDALRPTEWIAKCAERLHTRWHTVETAQLEEIAVDIWKDDALRSMGPVEAAVFWLAPVAVDDTEGKSATKVKVGHVLELPPSHTF